jgi:Alginate export
MSGSLFRRRRLHYVSLLCAALLPTPAAAEHDLYSTEESRLVVNFNLVGAVFLNADALFGRSEALLGADTNTWGEFGAEFGLAWEHTSGRSTFFAELSGVYSRTGGDDASGLTIGVEDSDQASAEQAHVGWRFDDPFNSLEEDTFSFSVGNQDYLIGTGLLIADGGSDGGEDGGWYLGMREAFQETVIASLKSNSLVAEGFFLKNRPRRGGVQGEAYGANLEYTVPGDLTLGLTYMVVDPRIPRADDLDVWSGRLGWTGPGGLELSGEYVLQDSSQVDADGWYGEIGWTFADRTWAPRISYRFADFDGDDPATATDERFRDIAYGYTDYGSWAQGEITGTYPLGNGNLESHQFRLKAVPNDRLTLNLLYYDFSLNVPPALGPAVTGSNWGDEINLTADWAVTDKWYLIGVLAALFPGDAASQWVGGDEDWLYSMFYVSCTY